jgi:type IV pilus assembly protein PilM
VAGTRVIGLDIGTTAVRASQLEFGSGGPSGKGQPTLTRFGQVALPMGAVRDGEVAESAIVSSALRQLWTQAKFDSRDVVIGVGNQRVVVRDLDLPWMPLAQIKASLAYQVQELLPMSTDEALLDYFPTGELAGPNGRMVRGMLVAAQRDTVSANILAVEGAGLRPVMVDLNAFALLRAIARGEHAQRTVALVDIGARVTNIVIASHGIPRLVRTLPLGGQNITDALTRALGIAAAEAEQLKREIGIGYAVGADQGPAAEAISEVTRTLVESIRNTFVYYSGNNPGVGLELAILTGGGSHLPGLGQYLSSASRLAVALGDPLADLKVAKSLDRAALSGQASLVALAVGLAYGVAA